MKKTKVKIFMIIAIVFFALLYGSGSVNAAEGYTVEFKDEENYKQKMVVTFDNDIDTEYAKQYVVLKNGERVEFSDLTVVENTGGKAYSCPLDGDEDEVRIQLINLDNERLVFDRSFILISSAECTLSF